MFLADAPQQLGMSLTAAAGRTLGGLFRGVTGVSALITAYYYVSYFLGGQVVWDLATAFYWTLITGVLYTVLLIMNRGD